MVDLQEVRKAAWHFARICYEYEKMGASSQPALYGPTANMLRDLADEVSRLRSLQVVLEMSVENLKKDYPCDDCKGGIYGKYCPTCNEWHGQGRICLHCDTETTHCPTCFGSGKRYG